MGQAGSKRVNQTRRVTNPRVASLALGPQLDTVDLLQMLSPTPDTSMCSYEPQSLGTPPHGLGFLSFRVFIKPPPHPWSKLHSLIQAACGF